MRIKTIQVKSYKRFTDLTITDLTDTVRLVVMTGPNGSGKSSLFDAFRNWHMYYGLGGDADPLYHQKQGLPPLELSRAVAIQFHDSVPESQEERKKIFYIRSAYRNEPDFSSSNLQRIGSLLDARRVTRLIDNDTSVSDNYRRLVSATVDGVYSGDYDSMMVSQLRDSFVGEVRQSMSRVFDDVVLKGPGDPLNNGSFFFDKGASKSFHYKNLSGGEKAAFDVLLDLLVKRRSFDNTVFCIDEPEAHMHSRLQGRLLQEVFDLIPPKCQLWIATHSIGMVRKARDLQVANPSQVVFLDFHDYDFDQQITLRPASADRKFWERNFETALDDLAHLVAPKQIVLCEGRPARQPDTLKAEFDARCYRVIFASDYPDTDFISVGNASDVVTDRLEVGRAIQTLISGTTVTRLVDRDDRSDQETAELKQAGVRVLSRRHLEAYLLDDEILSSLCQAANQLDKIESVLQAKQSAMERSQARGNAVDDVKSAAGDIYNSARQILQLTQCGNSVEAFLRDTMAPLVKQGTEVYAQLRSDVFGQ